VLLLAAGTGITPILRLLPLIAQTKTTLINFNKTEKDIIWGSELSGFAAENPWLKIVNVLSDQPSYSGLQGRIRKEILEDYIINQGERKRLACVCGPPAFMLTAKSLLRQDFSYTDHEIHEFQG